MAPGLARPQISATGGFSTSAPTAAEPRAQVGAGSVQGRAARAPSPLRRAANSGFRCKQSSPPRRRPAGPRARARTHVRQPLTPPSGGRAARPVRAPSTGVRGPQSVRAVRNTGRRPLGPSPITNTRCSRRGNTGRQCDGHQAPGARHTNLAGRLGSYRPHRASTPPHGRSRVRRAVSRGRADGAGAAIAQEAAEHVDKQHSTSAHRPSINGGDWNGRRAGGRRMLPSGGP